MNSGVPGSTPSSWSRGISVLAKRSKFSCVSQTSETRNALVGPNATAKSRPLGEPSPAASRRLMTSSYCCEDNDGGVKRTTKAMFWLLLSALSMVTTPLPFAWMYPFESRTLRPALPPGHALLERRRVNAIGFAFGDCLIGGGKRFFLPTRVVQDVGFGGETSKRRLGFERLLDVLQR